MDKPSLPVPMTATEIRSRRIVTRSIACALLLGAAAIDWWSFGRLRPHEVGGQLPFLVSCLMFSVGAICITIGLFQTYGDVTRAGAAKFKRELEQLPDWKRYAKNIEALGRPYIWFDLYALKHYAEQLGRRR